MNKVIELAHKLGEEIAKSDEFKNFESAKENFDSDALLQAKVSEFETERMLLAEEFSKSDDEADKIAITNLKARLEELSREINANHTYIIFKEAQNTLNNLMNSVNAEIKFAITGERPQTCTHDCSTCGGCSH